MPGSRQFGVLGSSASQNSKWPSSSVKEVLEVPTDHGTRVCSLEVEYTGWKLYGATLPVGELGCVSGPQQQEIDSPYLRAFVDQERRTADWKLRALLDRKVVRHGRSAVPKDYPNRLSRRRVRNHVKNHFFFAGKYFFSMDATTT
jgi:hypothetical protein